MKFIVFGLGTYGASLSSKLVVLGHEVIGVDKKIDLVEKWNHQITHTIALDATSPDAIKALPLKDVDAVINAIGEDEGVNIMATALLVQNGVKRIICRVTSPLQQTVLEAMNVKEFVYPEGDSAERMAYKLDLKGVTDSFMIRSDKFKLIEIELPKRYVDKKIKEIDFLGRYHIQPVTIVRETQNRNILGTVRTTRVVQGVLTPDTVLQQGDKLLLFGDVGDLERFMEE
ncbi:MAG: TrkA family potassium uptake protein [Cyclobacteriaceae bacterium]